MLFTDVQRSVRLNKKKKSTNTSPYPDEVIDRLARAFYPAIPACWSNNAGVSCTADGIVSSYPRKEKQSVPDGERPISLVIYGSFRVRSQGAPCFCSEPSPAF